MSESHSPSPSDISANGHIQDLRHLLESMTLSNSSLDTITWTRKTVEETITLSKSSHMHARTASPGSHRSPSQLNRTTSVSASASMPAQDPLPHISPSLPAESCSATALPAKQSHSAAPAIPKPSEISAPRTGLEPEGFWVITVGQEVGIFYHWADVAERTNFISGNVQKSYPSFQKALDAYTVKYNDGGVHAVPTPGGPFWPPSPSSSSSSDDLWSQVEDLSETF